MSPLAMSGCGEGFPVRTFCGGHGFFPTSWATTTKRSGRFGRRINGLRWMIHGSWDFEGEDETKWGSARLDRPPPVATSPKRGRHRSYFTLAVHALQINSAT